MFKQSSIILVLLSLSLALALSPTIPKNYFFVASNNHLSYELFQIHNGIVSHSIETTDAGNHVSRYVLINLATKDASPILADTVKTCDIADATFQHLHYHVQTDSLVYFCSAKNSLFIIDQSSFTVQTVIPLSLEGSWPVAKLSTDGMSVVVLGMDTLYNSNPQASVLIKVDMQTKKVAAQILLNQNLAAGEAVVAYAAGKKATYVATNKFQDNRNLTTTVYSIMMIGSTYQLTPVSTFSLFLYPVKMITKLFCLGNYVVVNNGPDVHFLNQQGKIVQSIQASQKHLTSEVGNGLSHAALTAPYDGTSLYVHSLYNAISKYSLIGDAVIQVKELDGVYRDMQIAYGNPTSADLAFTINHDQVLFSVFDLQTFKSIYSAVSGYTDLMLTETTYAVIQGVFYSDYHVYVFDLKTDALITKIPLSAKYYHYNKDQKTISFLNDTTTSGSGCALTHIDLVSGKVWTTLNFSYSDPICFGFVVNARITENGNPEALLAYEDHYLIISETYGQLTFETTSQASVNFDNLNINFDDLSFYYLVSDQAKNQVNASHYTFSAQSKKFQLQSSNLLNVPTQNNGLFTVNSTITVALSATTLTVIKELSNVFSAPSSNNYNLITAFQDSDGKQYVLLAYTNVFSSHGSTPSLFCTDGSFSGLPGIRSNTISAQATGPKSFALYDDLYRAVGLVRFYSDNSNSKGTKTFLSNLKPEIF